MKARHILTGFILIASVACSVKEEELSPFAGAVTTRIETDGTKASFDGTEGKLTWDTGDQIAVHIGSSYVTKEVTPVSGTDPAAGHITITEETASTTRNYYAVYPASSAVAGAYGNTTLSVNLPSSITITGKGDDYSYVPMVAVNAAGKSLLYFRPVGGLVRITCSNVPKSTRTIKVTLDKTITGTFTVANPASTSPSISSPGTSTDNYVVFTVAGEGGLTTAKTIVLNVPVPCGTYSSYKVETFTTADASGTAVTSAEHSEAHTFSRRHGWKLAIGNISMILNVTGPSGSFASAGGTKQYSIQSYKKTDSGTSNVTWTTEFYNEDGEKIAKPSWLTAFTESGTGSASATSYNATVSQNTASSLQTWRGEKAVGSNSSRAAATDLSMQDIYGNPIAQSTANCYVVSKPGWYKFPCVYGNALKNGTPNEQAYIKPGTTPDPVIDPDSGNYFLTRFPRHDDAPITAPWIKDNGITVSSAAIVWQDAQNMVSNVAYGSDYISFYIAPENIQHGNAVIAAKNSSNTILWSWHIWVIEGLDYADYLDVKTVYANTTGFPRADLSTDTWSSMPTNIAQNEMMNINLGWYEADFTENPRTVVVKVIQNETGGQTASFVIHQLSSSVNRQGGNVFYQWGRKDPFPGYNANDQNYAADNPVFPAGTFKKVRYSTGCTFGNAIQKPEEFYYYTSDDPHAWANPIKEIISETTTILRFANNLWNMNALFNVDMAVTKTVYDPCPVGFKVPNRNAFTGFWNGVTAENTANMNVLDSWRHGFLLKCSASDTEGIYFPSTSLRECSTGDLRPINYHSSNTENTHLWTASRTWTPKSGDVKNNWNAIYFGFTNTATGASGDFEGPWAPETYGFSVRPVKE